MLSDSSPSEQFHPEYEWHNQVILQAAHERDIENFAVDLETRCGFKLKKWSELRNRKAKVREALVPALLSSKVTLIAHSDSPSRIKAAEAENCASIGIQMNTVHGPSPPDVIDASGVRLRHTLGGYTIHYFKGEWYVNIGPFVAVSGKEGSEREVDFMRMKRGQAAMLVRLVNNILSVRREVMSSRFISSTELQSVLLLDRLPGDGKLLRFDTINNLLCTQGASETNMMVRPFDQSQRPEKLTDCLAGLVNDAISEIDGGWLKERCKDVDFVEHYEWTIEGSRYC